MSKNKGKTAEDLLQEALVPVEEQPYPIPENWVWVRTGTLNNIVTGSTPSKKNEGYYGGSIPFFKPADLKGKIVEVSEYVNEDGLKVSREVPANSTLVCCIGSIGKVGYTQISGITNQQINALIPNQKNLDPLFTYYYCQSNYFNRELWNRSSSTTISIINKSRMSEIPFPLPPKEEQKRIADKVERLLNNINQSKQLIEEAKETFELRRAAILDKAFRGELTANWREDNSVVTAWDNKELKSLINSNRGIFDGPFGSNLKSEDYTDSGVQVIRLENIKVMNFDDSKLTYISEEKYASLEKHTLREGDIIFSSFVSENVRACLLPSLERPAINKADCFCIRPDASLLNKEYLLYFLSSKQCYNALINIVHGATRPRINLSQLKALIVPLPTIDEQLEIVRIVKALLNSHNQALETLNISNHFETLTESILSKAFKGELGTHNSTDKTAMHLLENIFS